MRIEKFVNNEKFEILLFMVEQQLATDLSLNNLIILLIMISTESSIHT